MLLLLFIDIFIYYLFIQHLLGAIYTNKHALMRHLINIYMHSNKYSLYNIANNRSILYFTLRAN